MKPIYVDIDVGDRIEVTLRGKETASFDDAIEVQAMLDRLREECYERNQKLWSGTFTIGSAEGSAFIIPGVGFLGDEPRFTIEIGEPSRRWTPAEWEAAQEVIDALLTSWTAMWLGATWPYNCVSLEGDEQLVDEVAPLAQRGDRAALFERLTIYHADAELTLRSEASPPVTISFMEQGKHWVAWLPCGGAGRLAEIARRTMEWAAAFGVEVRSGRVGFEQVLARQLFIELPTTVDREALSLEGYAAFTFDGAQRLIFRSDHRGGRLVGIAGDPGRVWIYLNPERDRLLKSSNAGYVIDAEELTRIVAFCKPCRAARRELEQHLTAGGTIS